MKNMVMIYCDELSCSALGCYGNPYGIATPNIDALAKQGVKFEQCYCASPVCVPSRFSMLTSLSPTRTGVYHNEATMPCFHLDQDYVSFPQVLKASGYATASFGKTHIPKTKTPIFEVNNEDGGEMNLGIKIREEASDIMKLPGQFQSVLAANYPEDKPYTPQLVTDNGIEWMLKQTTPFFIRFSYLQPHTPIVVPKAYVQRLDDVAFDDQLAYYQTSEFEKRFGEICDIKDMKAEDVVRMRKYYQAMVLWIDDQVGNIIRALKEHNLMENTVIMFTADHGASRGENGALAKQTFQPSSHHVPLIISGAGITKEQRTDICSNLDIGPTILSMCDSKVPEAFEGNDLFKMKHEEVYSIVGYGKKSSRAFPNKMQGTWSSTEGWPQRVCIRTNRYRMDMSSMINGTFVSEADEDIFFTDTSKDKQEVRNMVHEIAYKEIIEDLYLKLKAYSQSQKLVNEDSVQLDMKLKEAYKQKK